jgi:hypothetical protein
MNKIVRLNLFSYIYLVQYIKHLAIRQNMVGMLLLAANHQGLGGVSITVSFSFFSLFL